MTLIHPLTNRYGGLLAKTLNQSRVKVELDDLSLGVALQALMKRQVPAISKAEYFEYASFCEITADLLCHPHAHVLGDKFSPPRMRSHFSDCFKDKMQITD